MKNHTDPKMLSQRVIFPISRDMLERIDDYRYRRRIPSRAEAIRHLIELSLQIDAQMMAPPTGKRHSPAE
jgi:metal-responsive CopG/Arc/MetJ family transcriptional regulator